MNERIGQLETSSLDAQDARVAARRHEIVSSAAELFDRQGYHSTSMNDIARAVGLRKPTLYHYFSSKDEILYGIHDEFIELLIGRHETRLRTAMPPDQQILEVMGDILELMATHRGHVRVFFEHHRELAEPQHGRIESRRFHYQDLTRQCIEEGIEQGTFRDVDPQLATLAVFGVCNWAYQWFDASGELRSREVAYQFWDMLLRGISA